MTQIDTKLLNNFKAFQPNLFGTTYTPIKLFIPQFNNYGFFPQYPQYKALKEPIIEIKEKKEKEKVKEDKKFISIISKKKGRKNKNYEKNSENNIHDKFSNDNVKRRVKARFHNYIIYLLNYLIKKNFNGCKKKFLKINAQMTKDIGIEYNRNLMTKTIKEIILDVSKKYQDKNNNKECIKYILAQKNNEEIIKILDMTYKDLYTDYYLKSTKKDFDNVEGNESFEEHKEKLKEIYGNSYLEKFLENTYNFINFFMNGKKRKARKKKESDNTSHTSENEQFDTITNTNETTNDNNFENICNKKNMVSIGVQTEIENIHTKIITFS